LGSGFGWFVAVVLIAAIREKIRYSHIPAPLKGVGMAFLITGLMGLAFLGFLGFNI
jgi:Na+-transporting NADH:ubiquinone oxidoreductase subunit E